MDQAERQQTGEDEECCPQADELQDYGVTATRLEELMVRMTPVSIKLAHDSLLMLQGGCCNIDLHFIFQDGFRSILAGAARAPSSHCWRKRKMLMLQKFGIAQTDIAKMKAGGFHTVEAIWQTPTKELTDVRGMSEGKITKFRDAGEASFIICFGHDRGAQKMLVCAFQQAAVIAQRMSDLCRSPEGCLTDKQRVRQWDLRRDFGCA